MEWILQQGRLFLEIESAVGIGQYSGDSQTTGLLFWPEMDLGDGGSGSVAEKPAIVFAMKKSILEVTEMRRTGLKSPKCHPREPRWGILDSPSHRPPYTPEFS